MRQRFFDFLSCSWSKTKHDSSILSPLGTQRASKLKSTYLGTFSERFEQFCFGSVFPDLTKPDRNERDQNTPRPNRAVGSTKWTNTFDFKILKYTIRIIENATFQNIFACGFFFMAIFVYCKYKKMTWKPLISSIFAQKYNFLSWLPYPKPPFMHLAYSKQP